MEFKIPRNQALSIFEYLIDVFLAMAFAILVEMFKIVFRKKQPEQEENLPVVVVKTITSSHAGYSVRSDPASSIVSMYDDKMYNDAEGRPIELYLPIVITVFSVKF
jgi:hypothetical protein